MLLAGIPNTIPAVTINRVCTSGMDALVTSALQIQAGFIESALVGGVESMSSAPYTLPDARWGARLQNKTMVDTVFQGLECGSTIIPYPKDGLVTWARGKPYLMGETAEFLAEEYNISREEQDRIALLSHNRAENATKKGYFKKEIVPVKIKDKKGEKIFEKDEHTKEGLTMEKLAKLPTVFKSGKGTVTAGNASGLNDGASAMVIMSEDEAKKLGIEPLAYLNGAGVGCCAPEVMGISPVTAVRNLLKRMGRSNLSDYDRIEINEAFASQYLACEKQLGFNREVTNVNGSGIGLGHPIGSTGNRIIVTLIHELERSGKKLGMATLCGGGGISMAVEIERP